MNSENNELPALNKTILDVRKVLQDQLDRLNSDDVDIDKEYLRSEAIEMVATPLIQSAKIEAELLAKNPKFLGTGLFDNSNKKMIANG